MILMKQASPSLEQMAQDLQCVIASCLEVQRCYAVMIGLKEAVGLPERAEFPGVTVGPPVMNLSEDGKRIRVERKLQSRETSWTHAMRDWMLCYRRWCESIYQARQQTENSEVSAIMNVGRVNPLHFWTTQVNMALFKLAGTLHPIGMAGADGLGVIRAGVPSLPQEFREHTEVIGQRLSELTQRNPQT